MTTLSPPALVSRLANRLRPALRKETIPNAAAALLRAQQIQAVLRLAPLTMLANALNALVVTHVAWATADRWFLSFWTVAVGAVVVRGLRLWWPLRNGPARQAASQRAMRRAVLHASCLAALWGAIPLMLLPKSDGPLQLLVTAIITGMICAGGFALATTPWAGTVYVIILGAALATGLLMADFPLAASVGSLILIYTAIVIASVWSTARLFAAQFSAEIKAENQNEVIGLLLRDFEENASDLLWEIDAEGLLRHSSPRLASLFGASAQEMDEVSVMARLMTVIPGRTAETQQLTVLRDQLSKRLPFRDLPLATQINGVSQWWSITAKPTFDGQGSFSGWRGVAADVTEAHHAKRQLTWLAHFDPLTGLANRHQLRGAVAKMLIKVEENHSFAILYLDLDHFKNVNDTLGHAIGDALLKEVGLRLKMAIRPLDLAARLGGDEFAVLLENISCAEDANRMAQRILNGFQHPCEVQGSKITVRTSIGMVIAPDHGSDVDTLLNHADLALYAAKAKGRGSYSLFTSDIAQQSGRRLLIEQELRDAIERGEFSLHFQPQEHSSTRTVIGFEALLRWNHPTLGSVSPAEFIPIAEDAGFINRMGAWVLKAACQQAALWPESISVSVNVSSVQAMSGNLQLIVREALLASGLAAHRLELEITESIFLNETEATIATLIALRKEGIRIALDDFGTGYSSLSYLRRFPFDTLKIDRAFISSIAISRELRAIVKMIIGLAKTLSITTVAEGVEDAAQFGILKRYGCDAIQGYHLAKPMPASSVNGFLVRHRLNPAEMSEVTITTDMMPLGV